MTDRVWTIPNVLSMLRIACVPAFLVLLAVHQDGWAFAALVVSGVSDFLDGHIARRYHQVSRLGQVLDPIADRLFIVSTVLGLAVRQIVPWWLVAVLLLRDVVGTVVIWWVRRMGYRTLATSYLGKAATFCLLVALPLILLAVVAPGIATGVLALGWAFAWWGIALYWLSMGSYVLQAWTLARGGGGGGRPAGTGRLPDADADPGAGPDGGSVDQPRHDGGSGDHARHEDRDR